MNARRLPVLAAVPAQGPPAPPGTSAHDGELVAQGWTRRFMATESRAAESAALYQDLGFEVRLEPPGVHDLREECGDCHLALLTFRILYTRKPA